MNLSNTFRRLGDFLDTLLFGSKLEELRKKQLDFEEELASMTRRIEISSRRLVQDVLGGEYHSVFKGRGMEFSEVREYFPGDDIRDIDWNVTARTGDPYVKIYTEERELTVVLVVDASASGDFGSTGDTKRVVAARVCAMLAFSAIANNDRVGLLIFTDEVETFVPPKKGKKHVLRLIREILSYEPKHAETDIKVALEHLNRVQRRKAVVFLISDFLDKGFEQPMQVAARRHDMIAVTVSDPLEDAMKRVGLVYWQDNETGEVVGLDTADERSLRLYNSERERDQAELDRFFQTHGIDFIALKCGEQIDLPLVKFFKKRMLRR